MANSLFQWLIIGLVAALHPFFVSVIDIDHNTKEKSVDISVRIFTDDFEKTLKQYSKTTVDLTKATNEAANDKLIANYINQKLQLKIDGKPAKLNYVGYEQIMGSTWAYFEITNIATIKQVDVSCNLLYEYQEKQQNIVHVKVNAVEKSYKLDKENLNTSFNF